MRVGILTFPGSQSYGASLQMMGLYRTLQDLDCTVEVINYMNPFMKGRKHVPVKTNQLRKIIGRIKGVPKVMRFKEFEKCIMMYPDHQINDHEQLSNICKRYAYVICGSDQVWNPLITGSDYSYFFDFIDDSAKKIAYAPSFGVTSLEDKDYIYIKHALERFTHISVREESGKKLVKELTGVDCPVVIDPSMLRTREEWKCLEKKVKQLPEKYIMYFMLNNVDYAKRFAEKLSVQTGYPIVNICGIIDKNRFTGKNMSLVGPDEWLYTMDNASYVITDSFHGAVFSILFEKENFISLASVTNSRLKTLLDTVKLKNRILDSHSVIEQYDKIDYTPVREILAKKRNEGISFLKESMNFR